VGPFDWFARKLGSWGWELENYEVTIYEAGIPYIWVCGDCVERVDSVMALLPFMDDGFIGT
jgi:hypothetical protein